MSKRLDCRPLVVLLVLVIILVISGCETTQSPTATPLVTASSPTPVPGTPANLADTPLPGGSSDTTAPQTATPATTTATPTPTGSAGGGAEIRTPTPPPTPSPSVTAAPVSAANQILFASLTSRQGDIYTVAADGSNLQQLTNIPNVLAYQAAWAPDGQQIAFIVLQQSTTAVYVMDASGANQRRLTTMEASHKCPQWSPAGRKILFTTGSTINVTGFGQQTDKIYVVDADGTNLQELADNYTKDSGNCPGWSPDGHQVLYTGYDRPDSTETGLFIMDANGANKHNILPAQAAVPYCPRWSPDGQHIAYQAFIGQGSYTRIVVTDVDGRNLIDLGDATSDTGRSYGCPVWAPDSRRIAFGSKRSVLQTDIYVADITDSSVRQITNTEQKESGVAWAPGNKILFSVGPLMAIDADGTNLQTLVSNQRVNGEASWRP